MLWRVDRDRQPHEVGIRRIESIEPKRSLNNDPIGLAAHALERFGNPGNSGHVRSPLRHDVNPPANQLDALCSEHIGINHPLEFREREMRCWKRGARHSYIISQSASAICRPSGLNCRLRQTEQNSVDPNKVPCQKENRGSAANEHHGAARILERRTLGTANHRRNQPAEHRQISASHDQTEPRSS